MSTISNVATGPKETKMHMYSNTSNARAAARKLVDKHPEDLIVAFPIRAPGVTAMYYGAVAPLNGKELTPELVAEILEKCVLSASAGEPPLETALGDAPAPKKSRRKAAKRAPAPKVDRPARVSTKEPRTSKASIALGLMHRPQGATAEELMKAMGWLPHTVRGFVSNENRLNKRGIDTVRKSGETTRYVLK